MLILQESMFRSGKCLKNITLLMFWMSLQEYIMGVTFEKSESIHDGQTER